MIESPGPGLEPLPNERTIYTILEENGFEYEDIERFNTEENDAAQHTIAHRCIAAPSSTQSANNSTAAPSNAQNLNNMEGGIVYANDTPDGDHNDANLDYYGVDDRGIGRSTSSSMVHNQESNTKSVGALDRPLVVVAIRGTLTGLDGDLGVDIFTQLG